MCLSAKGRYFITKKRIILLIGIGCILWGYYQLFVVDMEESFVNKQVTVLTAEGELTGKAVTVKNNAIAVSHNATIIEVPKHSIVRVEGLRPDAYETRRVLYAITISVSGGIIIWIALFFL